MANFKEEILLLKIVADVSKSAKDIAGLADVLDKPVSSIAELEAQAASLKKALKELPQEGTKGFEELSRAIGAVKFIDTDEAGKELATLFDSLNRQLGQSQAKLKQFNDELGRPSAANANIRLLADSFEDIRGVLDRTPQSIKEVEDRLKILQTSLKKIPAEGTDAFEQLTFEIANLAGADGNLDNAAAGITDLQQTITREIIAANEQLKTFRASLKAPLELPEGSLNAMRQELILLRREFDNLSAVERESEFGQQLAAQINRVDAGVRQLEESTGRAQRNVGAYRQAIKEALDEYRTIPEIKADIKALGAEQAKLTTIGNRIALALKNGGDEAERLADILRAQGKTGKDAQDILQRELLETKKALQEVGQNAARSNAQLQSIQGDLRSTISSVGSFAKGALLAIGADLSFQAIKSAVSDTIKTFADFEQKIATLASILGKPIERIRELRQNAEQLGAATAFSASQVAELQTEFAKVGFNEQQIIDATESTLALAQATGETLANSAAVAGATLQGFGIDASQTQRVTDVMAKSFNNTALDLESFKLSMKQVAPIARAANVSLEESTAILGALSNAGIKGEMAGTSVKNILAGIGDESSGLSKFLGVTVNSFDELVDALQNASTRTDNFGRANKFLGEQMRPAVLALLNNADALRTLRNEYENAAGAALRTAEIQSKTLNFAIDEFTGSVEGLQIAVGSRLTPSFKSVVEQATSFVNLLQGIVATPISEQLQQEQVALNGLALSLLDATAGTERYKLLQEELTQKYPELIEKIDTEEATLQSLLVQLTNVASSDEDRLSAITQLTKTYPDFIGQLTAENSNLATLIPQLTDSNLSQNDKLNLVQQLKSEYPDFLAFINENTSFEAQLRSALSQTNREYVNRIILQQQREKLEEKIVTVATKTNRQFELERSLNEAIVEGYNELVKINGKYANSIDLSSGSLEERRQAVVNALKSETSLFEVYTPASQALAQISTVNQQYAYALKQVENAQVGVNEEQTAYDDVLKRLGMSTGEVKDNLEVLYSQLEDLKKQATEARKAGDPLLLSTLDFQMKEVEDKIRALGGKVKAAGTDAGKSLVTGLTTATKKEADKALPGTVRFMREKLSELRKEIDNTPDLGKRVELIERASDIEKKINKAEELIKAFEARNQGKAIEIKLDEKGKLQQQIEELNKELDNAARQRRVRIEGEIEDVMDKLIDLQKEINDTFDGSGDSGSIELKPKFEEYKVLKAQIEDLQNSKDRLATPREIEIKAEIDKTKAAIDELNDRAATFSSLSEFTITPDFTQLTALEGSLERLNTELATAQAQAKIDVELQTRQAQERLAVLSSELLELTGKDITPKLKEAERLKAQLAELKAQLDADVPEERELVIKASITAAEQLLGKIDAEVEALRNKEVQLPILTDALVEAQKQVDVLQAKLQNATGAEQNRLQIDITAAQANVEELENQILALADSDVTVSVDILGLSDSEVAKLFDSLIKGSKGVEEAIGAGAKIALEQQLKNIAEAERTTLASLANISDATATGTAQQAALELQLTDLRRQQEEIRLRYAIAATQEGTDERRKAILDLLIFETEQTKKALQRRRSIEANQTEQDFLQRKNAIATQLAAVTGSDDKAIKRRAQLEKELTKITLQEEIARKEAANRTIDAQIAAQQKLLESATLSADARTEAEAEISDLQTERLKNEAEILDKEVELTKAAVDKKIEEEKRLEEQRKEIRDASFQVLDTLAAAYIQIEQNRLEASVKAQEYRLTRRYNEEVRLAGDNAEAKARIDAKFEQQKQELERQAAKKRQNLAVKEAIVQGALAVIKALATGNYVSAIAAGILAGIQIAIIKSQQFATGGPLDNLLLMMATGGMLPDGLKVLSPAATIPDKGTITGKLHRQGGVKATYKGIPVEVEGGEGTTRIGKRRWIFNRGVMQDPVLRRFAMQTHQPHAYNPTLNRLAGIINTLGLENMRFALGGPLSYKPLSYHIVPPPAHFAEGGALDAAGSASSGITNLLLRQMLIVLEGIRNSAEEIETDVQTITDAATTGSARAQGQERFLAN